MKPKCILHLLTSKRFSGAENVACQIIACFDNASEYEMKYCSPDGQIRNALEERNICFIPMKEWSLSEVKRVIREEKPDIIHAHDMKASFFAALSCGNIPLISHIHNNNFNSQKVSMKSLLYYYAAKKSKHIFWVSKATYEGYAFHQKFADKSSILYNVIDADAIYQKALQDGNHYSYDIVYIGRLTFQKNPQRLVEVLSKINQKNPAMKAAIVGAGDLEEETRQTIRNFHAENCIDMLGYSNNPYKIMQDAKILIMTSRFEGLPMCALEAMALGMPIVSTPTDGLREIVEDGVTGYLSDSDDVLIERCCDILNDEKIYNRLRQETLKKVKTILDRNAYKAALDRVYRQV